MANDEIAFELLVLGIHIPPTRCSIQAHDLESFKTAIEGELGIEGSIQVLEFFDPDFGEWAFCTSLTTIPRKVKVRISVDTLPKVDLDAQMLNTNNNKNNSNNNGNKQANGSNISNNNNNNTGGGGNKPFMMSMLNGDVGGHHLVYIPNGSLEFNQCKEVVEDCFGVGAQLNCSERIENTVLERRFREKRSELKGRTAPTIKRLHGGTPDSLIEICKNGFPTPDRPGLCGLGLYFSTDLGKSDQYSSGTFKVLLCEIAVGKEMQVDGPDPTITQMKLESAGFDSVYAPKIRRKTGESVEFHVVYHPDQIIPRYILTFTIKQRGISVDHQCSAPGHTFGPKEIEAFCDSCNYPICLNCIHLGSHKGHGISKLSEAHQHHLTRIHEMLRTARSGVVNIDVALSDYQNARTDVEHRREELLHGIREQATSMIEAVQARQKLLVEKVMAISSRMLEQSAIAEEDCQRTSERVRAAMTIAEEAVREWGTVDFLMSCKQLETDLKAELDASIHTPDKAAKLDLRIAYDPTSFLESLSDWQFDQDKAPGPPLDIKAIAAGPGSVRVSWKAPQKGGIVGSYCLEMAGGEKAFFREIYRGIQEEWLGKNLQLGCRYRFRVKALSVTNITGAWGPECDSLTGGAFAFDVKNSSGVSITHDSMTAAPEGDAHSSTSGPSAWAVTSPAFRCGRHKWDIRIDSHGGESNIFIGATREGAPVGQLGSTPDGWAFFSESYRTHAKYHGGVGGTCTPYGKQFASGDVVSVYLDLDVGTIEFAVNDERFGVAFSDVTGPVVAAISFNPTATGAVTLTKYSPW